jgi:hypothetical protein
VLANDSTEADKTSAFFLVIRTDHAVAELMAECPKCAAITSYSLELAWRLRTLTCSACQQTMRLHEVHLTALRQRLIEARVRVDALIVTPARPD